MAFIATSASGGRKMGGRPLEWRSYVAAFGILLIIPCTFAYAQAIDDSIVMGLRGNLASKLASLPMMLVVLGVFIGGSIWTFVFSLTRSTTLPLLTWAGFAQYTRLWHTDRWIYSIENLALYGVLYTLFSMIIGFFIAVFMDQRIRAEGLFRTVYLYPYALSLVVTGHVWAWILSPAYGLEAAIRRLGWMSFNFDWLTNRHMVMYANRRPLARDGPRHGSDACWA
jgi:ABC-type sugar transport system permease subunit